MELLISLVSGAIGGNVAGGLMKNLNLGLLGNSITGILGGIGGQALLMLGMGGAEAGGAMDIGSIAAQVASGGVGGGVLLALAGMIRAALVR